MSSSSEDAESDFEDIREFFSATEWREMSPYDKGRFRNAKENFHAMQRAGFTPKPPQFMTKPGKETEGKDPATKRAKGQNQQNDDSDSEWSPSEEAQATRSTRSSRSKKCVASKVTRRRSAPQRRTAVKDVVAPPCDQPAEPVQGRDRGSTLAGPKPSTQRVIRYSRRTRGRRTDYTTLDDDDFLFCDDCGEDWEGDCPEHGPLKHIPDSEVTANDPERALHSVPDCLTVNQSKIAGAGLGVWTKETIPRRSRFGPYEGDVTSSKDTGYGWEIFREGKVSHCVDALDASHSNWMRYVNCARHSEEQNLHPYQHKGALFYRPVRAIPPNTELLVYYGASQGRDLGIDPKAYRKPVEDVRAFTGIFPCEPCGISFVSPLLQAQHKRSGHCHAEIARRRGCGAPGATPSTSAGKAAEDQRGAEEASGQGKLCDVCGARCRNNAELVRHMRMHTGERPFSCGTCGATFTVSGHLKTHMRTHTGQRPYSCSTCGAAFATSCHLKSHMRTHTKEKPYSCSICGAAFTQGSNLKKHMRTHTGEKPYSCRTCGASFTQGGTLTDHMRTHSKERPFSCATCDAAFTQGSALKSHMRTHTREKPYSCSTCGAAFTQGGNLKRHMRTHTGEKF